MAERVLIVGAGVAGMTAAHELVDRGFDVTVIEDRSIPGGKARSVEVSKSATRGHAPLPGEHGFRFFAGFYRHVPDTMARIPYPGGTNVGDNLVECPRFEYAQSDGPGIVFPTHPPRSIDDFALVLRDALGHGWRVPPHELAFFLERLLVLLGSCDERRYQEWEYQSWWDFAGANHCSAAYRKYLADGLTRTFVAAKAKLMSARTGGVILLQLLIDLAKLRGNADRILDGPTNDRWIGPWLDYLRSQGVRFRFEHRATGIEMVRNRVGGIWVEHGGDKRLVTADHYVCAVPLERMADLAGPDLREADPGFDNLDRLETRWMNGVQFYLHEDVPVVRGHVAYMDSPWALTSISQRQFWSAVDFDHLGDGTVGGILSVDVSDWETPGFNSKAARDCTRAEVVREVWDQLVAHLDHDDAKLLQATDLDRAHVDDDIRFRGPHRTINVEPLLINTKGSWRYRPDARTGVENLFLAGDYVRTYTDLACMEGANEGARRAVNAILDATGSSSPRCRIWPLHEPALFAPLRQLDKVRFRFGPRRAHRGPGGPPGP